jgi:hypothetical protein
MTEELGLILRGEAIEDREILLEDLTPNGRRGHGTHPRPSARLEQVEDHP